MTSHFEAQLSRLRRGLSAVELVYTPHDRWPLPRLPLSGERLNISVLDSSFNPPTLAHLALANTPFPQCFRKSPQDSGSFHAKLLLLSVRNADKSLKPSDATYAQRLDMMVSLARDSPLESDPPSLHHDLKDEPHSSDSPNIAVGIIDEPTFVGKSHILQEFLRAKLRSLASPGVAERTDGAPQPKLTFLVGMDTLERLFAPRYYASEQAMQDSLQTFFAPDKDDSHIISARRVIPELQEPESERENRIVAAAKDYLESSRIALVDIDESVRPVSSSEVRGRISRGDGTWASMVTRSVAEYVVEHDLYRKLT